MAVKSAVPGVPQISLTKLAHGPRATRPPVSARTVLRLPHVPAASKPRSLGTIKVKSQPAPRAVAKPTQAELGISSAKPKAIPVLSKSFMGSTSSSGGFTAAQMLEAMKAKQRSGSHGLLDDIKGAGGSVLGSVLDVLSRPGWAIAGGTKAALEGQSTAHVAEEFGKGALGDTHHNFGEILKEHHILSDHTIVRAIAGMGLDIATDPTNLLLIAAAPETGGATGYAFLVKEGLLKGLADVGTKATVEDLMAAAGRHEATWKKALAETPFGDTSLAKVDAQAIRDMTPEQWGSALEALQKSNTFAAVRQQAEMWLPRKMTVGIWLPTLMGGRSMLLKNATFLRVMPYAPNMLRIAEGLTPLSHVPGIARGAAVFNDLFKPGWRDPILHATEMGRKHTAEAIFNTLNKTVHGDFLERWGKAGVHPEHLADAIDVGTLEGAAKEHPDLTRTVNDEFLRGHGLDDQQIQFLHDWNDVMNKQIVMEHTYGVKTEGSIGDRIYAPYMVERGFAEGGFKVSGVTKSFQHAREGQHSLAELRDLVAKKGLTDTKGRPQDIVTDPVDLLRARLIQGSQAMAHSGWRTAMTDLFGIPRRVPDQDAMAELTGRADEAQRELAIHRELIRQIPESHNAHLEEFHAAVEAKAEAVGRQIDEGIAERQRMIEELRSEQTQMQKQRAKAQAKARKQKEKGVVPERQAQQRRVANARLRASRAGSAIAEEMVHNLALAVHHADTVSEHSADNVAEAAVARQVQEVQRSLNREVQDLRTEIAQLTRQGNQLKAHQEQMRAFVDGGADAMASRQAEAFTKAQDEMTAWVDQEIAREETAAKQAHRILGPARNRVAELQAKVGVAPPVEELQAHVERLIPKAEGWRIRQLSSQAAKIDWKRKDLVLPKVTDNNTYLTALHELEHFKQGAYVRTGNNAVDATAKLNSEARAWLSAIRKSKVPVGKAELAAIRKSFKTYTESLTKYLPDGKLPASAKRLMAMEPPTAAAEEELKAAREQLKLVEPRAGQVGQRRVENVRSIGEKIAADLRGEDEKWQALAAQRADQIKEAPAAKVGALQADLERIDEMRKQYKNLAAAVANARTKKRLYELVGDSHGKMIDTIGKRETVVETPLLEELTVLRQKIRDAATGEDLHALAPEHPALDAFTHGGSELADHAAAASSMNEVGQQLNTMQDRMKQLVAQLEESVLRANEHKADNAHLFKQGDEYKGRVRERTQAEKKNRKAYEASLAKLEKLHAKLTDARADGMREQAKLHEMGGVERRGPAIKHHGRTITRLEREAKQLAATRDAKVMAARTSAGKRLERLNEQLHRARAESFRMDDVLEKRATEAQARANAGAWHVNPRIEAEGFKTLDSIPDHAFSQEVWNHLTRVEDVMSKPEGFEDVSNWLWRQMSRWKLAVTVLNPIGYRVRNTLSDIWNMYLNGMPLRAMPFYFMKAHKMLRAAEHDPRIQAQLLRAEFHGVMQGLFRGDVDHAYQVLHRGHVGGRVPVWNRYVRFQINSNTHVENMGRLAHMLWRTEHAKTGLRGPAEDFEHAAFEVRRSHFDYEDLTPFEQHKAKALMPFYTWTRKNVPYQLSQIVRRPGRVAAFSHLVQESELAAGSHKGELIPSFFEQAGAFRIPGLGAHWYFLPNIGLMDISRMTSVQGWEGMLGPQYQIPMTLMTNRNLFTGGQIQSDTHSRNPVNPTLGALLSHIPFMDVGPTQRMDAHGHEIKTTGMNPYALYLLESLGIPLSRVALGHNAIDESRKNPLETWSGQLGLPLQYADQAQQKQIIDLQEQAQLKLWLEQMRAAGAIPESKRQKKSANRSALDKLIYGSYGRP